MTAPVASGWSGCRVGLAPTGKRRLSTAHTPSGRRLCIAAIEIMLLCEGVTSNAGSLPRPRGDPPKYARQQFEREPVGTVAPEGASRFLMPWAIRVSFLRRRSRLGASGAGGVTSGPQHAMMP
jgi:hypothetical protein